MNKNEFLHKLKLELNFYLSSQECRTVIEDYAEYFDSALAEGRSEEEICLQLDDVKKLSKEIIFNGYKKKTLWLRNIANKINCIFDNTLFTKSLTLLPIAIGIALWTQNKGWIFWKFLWIWHNLSSVAPNNITNESILVGQSASGNIAFLTITFISLSFACLIWCKKNVSLYRMFQMPFYIGAFVSFGSMNHLLGSLMEPYLFTQSLLRATIPLFCGLIISVILFITLSWLKRGTKKNDITV
jgi:uncharacterized membrane protein